MFTPHTAARQIVVNKVDMEVFAHGTVAFPVAFYDVDFSVEQFLWHWHDEFEIGVVMEGKMLVTIGSKEYTLKTGEAYFANAGVLHAGRNHAIGEPCRLHIIVFHPVLISGDTRSIFWQEFVHPLMEDHSLQGLHLSKGTLIQQQVVAAVSTAWQSYAEKTPDYPFRVRQQLSDLVFLISKRQKGPQGNLTPKYLRDSQRTQRMMDFISRNYADAITLREIATSASISPSECLRCFHSIIHTTPIQYLMDFRIKQAAELLRTTQLQVSEIARRCGFMEMSYFSKVFKMKYGYTPMEFRKQKN